MLISKNDIFTPDITTDKKHIVYPCVKMETTDYAVIETVKDNSEKAISFANEINRSVIGDFEKNGDKMCHVSTFCYLGEKIYVSY